MDSQKIINKNTINIFPILETILEIMSVYRH